MIKDTYFKNTDEIINIAAQWFGLGKKIALATVVKTWGSSPRPLGSQLLICQDGQFEGSVSGGCIEGAVIEEAIQVIKSGQSQLLTFGIANENAWEVGLSCGGEIQIHVRKIDQTYLSKLQVKRPYTLVTNLKSGDYSFVKNVRTDGPLKLCSQTIASSKEAILADTSSRHDDLFLHVMNPPLRMIIIGAVHIAQALVPMANVAGFNVILVDPRSRFTTPQRFPETTFSNEWPDDAVTELAPDSRTAIITLSHDPKIDDPALHIALKSDAFYISCLGSRRTHEKRVARLIDEGFNEKQISRIQAPGGLDIGSKSPAEIAVSILAEAIATKYNKHMVAL